MASTTKQALLLTVMRDMTDRARPRRCIVPSAAAADLLARRDYAARTIVASFATAIQTRAVLSVRTRCDRPHREALAVESAGTSRSRAMPS